MADNTIVELVADSATAPWNGPVGQKYAGIVCGLANDSVIEAASKAMQSALLYPVTPRPETFDQPEEAIDALGRDAMLLRYPGEDAYTSLRTRVRGKWVFWRQGIKGAMLAELAVAGFPGAQIKVPNDYTPRPAPSSNWSRFWIFFPAGTHPVTASAGFVMGNAGSAQVGRDRLGPTGLNTAAGATYLNLLKSVVARMKPAQWVAWNVIFEISAGVSYVHLEFKPGRINPIDPHYAYTSAGAALPLGV